MIKQDISYYGSEDKIKENMYYVLFSKHKEIIGLIMINNWLSGKPLFNDKNKNEILETLNIFINHTALALENHNIYNKLLETQRELISLEKNKILAEAAFTMSHEIRNPLHAISGFTQIMRKNNYPIEKQKDFFNRIMEASDRINHVVEKFTNFSSILSTPPKFVFIELNKIIEKAVEKEQEWLCSIKLNLKLDDSPATYLDNNKLAKAFQEIIRNACKSMEQAEKKVLEIKSKINKNNNTIRIEFKDSGKGIDKKHLNKIFDPLFTMTDYRKSETPGLGLSMARIVIETYHHGNIDVKCLRNNGTIITVTLPMLSKVSKHHQEFLINVLSHL